MFYALDFDFGCMQPPKADAWGLGYNPRSFFWSEIFSIACAIWCFSGSRTIYILDLLVRTDTSHIFVC